MSDHQAVNISADMSNHQAVNKNADMSDRQVVIMNTDMSEEMAENAVDYATQALEKYSIERDMAAFIAESFNKRHNPTWNCIVGREFAISFSHEKGYFIFFYLGYLAILLFKSEHKS